MNERAVQPRRSVVVQSVKAICGIFVVLLFGCAKAENGATAAHFDPAWADEWSPAVTQAYGARRLNRSVEGASRPQSVPDVDWRLTGNGVFALDPVTGKTLAEIKLPEWTWVREEYACPPVLSKGPQGEAIITSNVTTTLWRVDPRSFEATVHELAGTDEGGMEFGFSGLAYSPEQRAFFAVPTVPGALWRIDAELRQARKIAVPDPLAARCGAAPRAVAQKPSRLVSLCVGGTTVNLSVDQRTGYVNGRPC